MMRRSLPLALGLVLVPRHDLADFLHACLDAGFACQRDEHQGKGQAVGAPLLPDLADGEGRIGVVLQIQAVAVEDHLHQRLQALLAGVTVIDHLRAQHVAHRRWNREHLLRRRHRRSGGAGNGQRRGRSRMILCDRGRCCQCGQCEQNESGGRTVHDGSRQRRALPPEASVDLCAHRCSDRWSVRTFIHNRCGPALGKAVDNRVAA